MKLIVPASICKMVNFAQASSLMLDIGSNVIVQLKVVVTKMDSHNLFKIQDNSLIIAKTGTIIHAEEGDNYKVFTNY
jgi:hypothetical protein